MYKILLIGETCVDKYIYGQCNRLSPEAPVPVLNHSRIEVRGGMAENVFQNMMSLKSDQVDVTTILFEAGIKERFIDEESGYQLLRLDNDIIGKDSCRLYDTLDIHNYNLVVVSDYDKGYIGDKLYQQLSTHPNVLIDTKKENLGGMGQALVKINKREFESLTFKHDGDYIITLGPNGCMYKNKIYKTHRVEVMDVTGAGDTFLAALAVSIGEKTMEEAIRFANKAASFAVSKQGTYIVTKQDMEK